MIKQTSNGKDRANRRKHTRLPMSIPVTIRAEGAETFHRVQNQDISWGGVRFLASKAAVANLKSVTVTFPWSNGRHFSALAEVVRKDSVDDETALVAARFSRLSTADQHRLEKLLQMLHGAGAPASSEPNLSMAPVLEIFFSDTQEIYDKLAEIAEGRFSMTVFESYEPGQSIRLVLGGIADVPALRLRARVVRIEAVQSEAASEWAIFNLELSFEHPADELKAAAASLEHQLATSRATSGFAGDAEDMASEDLLV